MNVDPGASCTRSRTGAFEHIESSMRTRLYGKRLIDHFLQRARRVRIRTHILAVTLSNGGLFHWEAHIVCGGILTCYILSDNEANFDFWCRRQSPLQLFNHYPSLICSRRPRSTRQCAEAPCIITYCRIGACLGIYRALACFRSTACLV